LANNDRTLVIVPTYNEIESLPVIINKLLTTVPEVHILIADDNSPDGTGELADKLSTEHKNIKVLHRPQKEGLGKAYLAAFNWAIEHGYERVVELDSDGSHPVETLPKLLQYSGEGADLVIGSRYTKGGETEGWSKARWLLSKTANLYAGLILRIPIKDITAGYRVYTTKALQELDLVAVDAKGYYFQVAMTIVSYDAGLNIVETPIVFREREAGHSKMSSNIVMEAMWKVTTRGLRRFFDLKTYKTGRRKQVQQKP
jgi:dolichol-phosphate mannosyltransferase